MCSLVVVDSTTPFKRNGSVSGKYPLTGCYLANRGCFFLFFADFLAVVFEEFGKGHVAL